MNAPVHTRTRQRKTLLQTGCWCVVGLLISFAFSLAFTSTVQAQSLGRLFSTPALRAELDRRRARQNSGVIEMPDVEPITLEELDNRQIVPDTIYELGGSMRRSDGSYTIWINNVPYAESDLPDNMELVLPYDRGQMRINNPESGESFLVKPGQVLNLSQGLLMESYQYRARTTALEQRATGATTTGDTSPDADSDPADPATDTSATAEDTLEQLQSTLDRQQ